MTAYTSTITLPEGISVDMELMNYKSESKMYPWTVTITNYPLHIIYTTYADHPILAYKRKRDFDYYNKVKLFMRQMKKWS